MERAMLRAYFRKSAAIYQRDKDQIYVQFDRPRRNEPLQQVTADAVCEISPAGELVRVLIWDHKRLRLGKLLAHFTEVPVPQSLLWGYITYDLAARVASFYLASVPDEAALRQVRRRAICEIDAQERLTRIVIPVRGGPDVATLRTAANQLPSARGR